MSNNLEYYNDENGDFRWRVKAGNHKIVSASDEGFSSLRKAMDNYQLSIQPVAVVTHPKKGKHDNEERTVHTGDHGSPAGGLIADSRGSAGEGQEADTD